MYYTTAEKRGEPGDRHHGSIHSKPEEQERKVYKVKGHSFFLLHQMGISFFSCVKNTY